MASRSRKQKRGLLGKLAALLRHVVLGLALVVLTYLGLCTILLILYSTIDPPTTSVQMQRHVESFFEQESYRKHYQPVSQDAISPHLGRAVVAAEDGRFYQHWGIDLQAVQKAIEERQERGRRRGASTLSQQLVKNLFLTTHGSWIRKGLEVPLTLLAELILSKERILHLYLNIVEWDRGVYGAEAAAQHYYGISASQLSRYQSAGLAACLPNPRYRSPQQMGSYTNTILQRMRQMGW